MSENRLSFKTHQPQLDNRTDSGNPVEWQSVEKEFIDVANVSAEV